MTTVITVKEIRKEGNLHVVDCDKDNTVKPVLKCNRCSSFSGHGDDFVFCKEVTGVI